MSRIKDDWNDDDEDNEIYENTKEYPIEKGNDKEDPVDSNIISMDNVVTGMNMPNMSFNGNFYEKSAKM